MESDPSLFFAEDTAVDGTADYLDLPGAACGRGGLIADGMDDDEYEDDDEVARQEELELLAALQLSLEEARQEARRSEQPIAEPSQRDE